MRLLPPPLAQPSPDASTARTDTRRRVLGGLALVALAGLLVWTLGAERRAVYALPTEERAALFEESWRAFQALCGERVPTGFGARCRTQAGFLLLFPECVTACRERAAAVRHWTR
ncbi:hypothetical protein P2318_00855 [Myxococcaceae bacterium GXIMD 01537]